MTIDHATLAHDQTQSLRIWPTKHPSSKIFYGWWVVFASAFGLFWGVLVTVDRTGSYIRPLVGFLFAILLATVLMTRLGPYRFRPRESKDDYLKHKVPQELRIQKEDQCL
jgi:hypothetical protein